ncbi:MAG: fibronectin type III domain-containing protein, partial [Candidatus Brocadiia bacterium]
YNVYRGGSQIATGVTSSQYSDTGLSPSTQYCYTVTAEDTSNNESTESNQACATTQEADTTPPAAPTNLTATAVSPSQIDLDWDDNTEPDLDSYNVYRDTVQIATGVTSSQYSDTGLSPSTQYCYTVTAVDTSGNESAESSQACATTQEGGSTMHVHSIATGVLHGRYPGYWAKVTIVDGNGDPVAGATVTGTFDGWDDDTQSNVTETISGVTGSDGLTELDSVIDSGQFCVDDVTHSELTYDSSQNVVTCVSF